MSSSLQQLHEVILQNEERQKKDEAERVSREASLTPLHEKIQNVWTNHGILSPMTGSWIRPVPSSLFTCPLSAPQTTLVPWSSLPHSIQSRLTPPTNLDNTTNNRDCVVEVPLSYLVTSDDENATTGITADGAAAPQSVQQRPLSGNLSDKLTEFTRGVVGQRKPFRPGGMDDDTKQTDLKNIEKYQSEEEIIQARKVLEMGSEASWKDGSILTSPPGADFDVGLSWNDVHRDDVVTPKGTSGKSSKSSVEDEEMDNEEEAPFTFTGVADSLSQRNSSTGMWDKTMFDDDSLFGESSSDSDSDEISSEDDSIQGEEDTELSNESKTLNDISVGKPIDSRDLPISEDASAATELDDVDGLLAELSLDDAINKPKHLTTLPNNPLLLAESHAKEQQEQTVRKSWADTKYLPIKDFHSEIPNPAMTFPFTLDDFQQQAVARIERSESIFVAAHTSAGKTVCAEYAIALCKQHCTRAVYTSPIKALSNQKFRDFCLKFGAENIGLITGDMQINVDDATCLIMTTEILRSMLYRGADLIRDIEWVIFDEVHYVNDTERGVVWEEVIIMLPSYVSMIFLSATTPNTIEFSDWIGRTKKKPVHVIRTDYRPVPLSHFLWAGLKLHKIMEGKGGFVDKGYAEATKALLPSSKDPANKKGGPAAKSNSSSSRGGSKQMTWQVQGNRQNWTSLVKFLDREGLTPAVVFTFSKKKCEEVAHMLRTLDLNTAAEKSSAHAFTLQTVARLSPNDSTLPQVLNVCEMVKRGIGVHHGGLLPILKEMVEILFSKGLVKVLFATETFAMGVNMPARAVVFNSIRKHDGTQFRVLEPGEYTQMAGRAGRRGLDKVGTVIMCCFGETPPPQPILRQMLTGSSTRLSSQFRLTFNMILNLLRVEDMSVEDMIKRSFSEFATQRALTANDYPKLLARGIKTLNKLDSEFKQNVDSRIGAEDVEDYYHVCSSLLNANQELLSFIYNSPNSNGPLVAGRVLFLTSARKHHYVNAPAIVLRPPSASGKSTVCLVLLPESFIPSTDGTDQSAGNIKNEAKPGTLNYIGIVKHRHYAIHEVVLSEILLVSATKYKIDGKALFKEETQAKNLGGGMSRLMDPFSGARPAGRKEDRSLDTFAGMMPKGKKKQVSNSSTRSDSQSQVLDKTIEYLIEAENKERFGEARVLDLRESVKQGDDVLEFRKRCSGMEDLTGVITSFSSHRHPSIEKHFAAVERKETLRSRVGSLRHILSNESLQLFPDFLQRKSLLRTLGYIDENETVCVKGRVACEVNTCEELIVTEMVFEGLLNELDPAEIVAALSSLVFQEKSNDEEMDVEIPERLASCCDRMKVIATNLGEMQKNHGIEIDPLEYCDNSLKFGLVHAVYEWALGVPFSSICQLTLVQEGSIVRCITRLDELLREVRNCARVVGNPNLYRKMETASVAIKRDIVFASSLYVS